MGWNQQHWHPDFQDGRDRDDDDDCGGAFNYFLYGGGIIVTILLVLVLLKLYFKLWVYCIDKKRRKTQHPDKASSASIHKSPSTVNARESTQLDGRRVSFAQAAHMISLRDCKRTFEDVPTQQKPPPHQRPCPPGFGYPPPSHLYYKYATVAVLVCGSIALLVIFWKCCRRNRGDGRVVAQPPPQEPVKPTPPPYSLSEYDNPPPYHVCVPDDFPQPPASGSQDVAGSRTTNATIASAPAKYPSPEPTHVVAMPRY